MHTRHALSDVKARAVLSQAVLRTASDGGSHRSPASPRWYAVEPVLLILNGEMAGCWRFKSSQQATGASFVQMQLNPLESVRDVSICDSV